MHRGFRAFRPPPWVCVIGNLAVEDLLVVACLLVHVRRRRLRFLYASVGLFALFEDDLVARLQIFSRFGHAAQVAVLLYVFDGCSASLQAGDALHPVGGFVVEHTAVAPVAAAGKQADVGVVTDRVLGRAEHFGELPQRVGHRVPLKTVLTSSNPK